MAAPPVVWRSSELADAPTGAFPELTDRFAGAGSDLGERVRGARPEVLQRFAGLGEHVARPDPDLLDGPAEAADYRRIAIESRQHTIDDHRDVVEADPEQRLCLHPFEFESNLAEMQRDADAEMHQIEDVGLERDMGVELLDLEMDPVDLHDGYIEDDVRMSPLEGRRRVPRVLAFGDRSGAAHVLREAVLLGLLRRAPALAIGARRAARPRPSVRSLRRAFRRFAGLRSGVSAWH